ncbi:P-loop ATPase, Sll1717 family [Brevundimonas vesicularis]|uniref:P-loop ATPase, Sll1717 family n=1 Tax=Brevundimonas vesicularis TaxID=41276 RepID=UPI003851454E
MSKAKRVNPVILKAGMSIGTGNAESDDDLLFECFVTYPPVDEALKIASAGMILAGRTGSGKTAILRYVQDQESHTSEVDPAEMSMNYVANSDALRFLQAIGADLDLLFQVLWKHVLCLEFIRLRWGVDNAAKSATIFDKIVSKFTKDDRKRRAVAYLQEWGNKFWITMDQNIKEITEAYEDKLNAEFAAEILKFKAGGQYEKRLSTEKKSELVARARDIISAEQLRDLHGVVEMLASTSNDDMQRCFILIDKIDERWVDESIRFRLIRALIASLKSFKAVRNLKILVALRTDILERVVQETSDITFQREKFEDHFIHIRWSKNDLRQLVDKRISTVLRRQYTGTNVVFKDVFTKNIKNKDPFDYMIERSHMRPRDLIAFVNECLAVADNQYEIAPTHIQRAEAEYSRKRRDALVQEWKSTFPSLAEMLSFITSEKAVSVSYETLVASAKLEELALSVGSARKISFDPIYDLCQAVCETKRNSKEALLATVLTILYRVGAIALKTREEDRFIVSHIDAPLVSPDLVGASTHARVHPMLHGAYRLNEYGQWKK